MADCYKRTPISWLCGDLHLENFGSFNRDNRLVYFDMKVSMMVCRVLRGMQPTKDTFDFNLIRDAYRDIYQVTTIWPS